MLVAAGSKETPPPAVRKRCGGWGLLIMSGHHHLNHAKSISCIVNFTSWFPAVSPFNFQGTHPEQRTTLKGCLKRRSCSTRTHACIYVNGDNGTHGWWGLSTLGNLYTCAMLVGTDTATKATPLPYSFQQICTKGTWIACCRWPCFDREVGLDDPQRSLPTPNILWFCDLDAILNQSYKILMSSPNWQTALKRSMLLLRFPPLWIKTTSCLKWFQWHPVWMLKICRSLWEGMWFPRAVSRFRKRKENTRDSRSRKNRPPRCPQWPPLKYTRSHMRSLKGPQSHLGDMQQRLKNTPTWPKPVKRPRPIWRYESLTRAF